MVSWGTYKNYEGPVVWGTLPVSPPPPDAKELDKEYYIAAKAEGGKVDATQAYDSGIITTGAIQVIEASSFGVSELLGFCKNATTNEDGIETFNALEQHIGGWELKRLISGKYRWVQRGTDNIADTQEELRQIYMKGSHGTVGSWNTEQKEYAKEVVRLIANLWHAPAWAVAQSQFLAPRLWSYAMSSAKNVLFNKDYITGPKAGRPYFYPTRALFISFSINSPARAASIFFDVVNKVEYIYGEDFFYTLCDAFCTGGFAHWPNRFLSIKEDFNKYYGIKFPKSSTPTVDVSPETHINLTGKEIQRLLINKGYSCGPSGADGIVGRMTIAAIQKFQHDQGLNATGVVDQTTLKLLIQ